MQEQKDGQNGSPDLFKGTLERTFRWMPRLDLYVLRGFLLPFSVLLFAFTLLFLIAEAYTDKDLLLEDEQTQIESGAPTLQTTGDVERDRAAKREMLAKKLQKAWKKTAYIFLKIPGNIRFIFPLTVLLSCMYTFANFGRNKEITAMRASGISLARCAFSIFVMAFFVMLVDFWFSEKVVPACSYKMRQLKRELDDKADEEENTERQFNSSDNKRNWMFARFDHLGKKVNVVEENVVKNVDGEKVLCKRYVSVERREIELIEELKHLQKMLQPKMTKEARARVERDMKQTQCELNALKAASTKKTMLLVHGENVRLKFMREIEDETGRKVTKRNRQMEAEYAFYDRQQGWMLYNCSTYIEVVEGLPPMLKKYQQVCVLQNEVDYTGEKIEIPETPDTIHYLSLDPDLLSVGEIYGILRDNPNLSDNVRQKYWTHLYQHLAFPWACFLCVFLVLPLAAKNERSGIFTAILFAVLVIVGYHVLSQVFLVLGVKGSLPPFVAGALPTVLFAAFGGYLFAKAG